MPRVLVVEDIPEVRMMLRLLLEVKGFQVEEAGDGPDGVRKAIEWRPEVAVVDIGLPGLDGYEVARRMRNEPWGRNLLLVALSGLGQEEHQRLTREAGFDRHVTKPADMNVLKAVLQESRAGA